MAPPAVEDDIDAASPNTSLMEEESYIRNAVLENYGTDPHFAHMTAEYFIKSLKEDIPKWVNKGKMDEFLEYDNGKGRIINITIEGSKKEGVLRVTNEMSVGELYGLIYHKDYLHPEGGEEYILYNESDKLFMVETLLPIWSYGLRNDCKVTVVKLPNNIYGEIFKLEIKKVREMELFTKEDDKLIEITSQFQIIKKFIRLLDNIQRNNIENLNYIKHIYVCILKLFGTLMYTTSEASIAFSAFAADGEIKEFLKAGNIGDSGPGQDPEKMSQADLEKELDYRGVQTMNLTQQEMARLVVKERANQDKLMAVQDIIIYLFKEKESFKGELEKNIGSKKPFWRLYELFKHGMTFDNYYKSMNKMPNQMVDWESIFISHYCLDDINKKAMDLEPWAERGAVEQQEIDVKLALLINTLKNKELQCLHDSQVCSIKDCKTNVECIINFITYMKLPFSVGSIINVNNCKKKEGLINKILDYISQTTNGARRINNIGFINNLIDYFYDPKVTKEILGWWEKIPDLKAQAGQEAEEAAQAEREAEVATTRAVTHGRRKGKEVQEPTPTELSWVYQPPRPPRLPLRTEDDVLQEYGGLETPTEDEEEAEAAARAEAEAQAAADAVAAAAAAEQARAEAEAQAQAQAEAQAAADAAAAAAAEQARAEAEAKARAEAEAQAQAEAQAAADAAAAEQAQETPTPDEEDAVEAVSSDSPLFNPASSSANPTISDVARLKLLRVRRRARKRAAAAAENARAMEGVEEESREPARRRRPRARVRALRPSEGRDQRLEAGLAEELELLETGAAEVRGLENNLKKMNWTRFKYCNKFK